MNMQRLQNRLWALGLVAAMGAGCDGATDETLGQNGEAIIHGDVVDGDGFPTVGMVMMIANAARMGGTPVRQPLGLCTGTLISPTAVLLAAHCVDPQILQASLQQAGITVSGAIEFKFSYENSIDDFIETTPTGKVFNEKPTLLPVASFEQMPINIFGTFTRPGQMDDIAVLHLATPVKGKPVQKLATPEVVAAMQTSSTHAVAGYGQTSNDPGDFNGDGTQDDANASAGTLHSGVSKLDTLGDHELIAGDMDDQQACHGDSGGPIFADETQELQLGVASRINAAPGGTGAPRCEPGLLYTRVDAYLTWIQSKVPDLGQATEPCAANDPSPTCGDATGGAPDAGGPGPGSPDAGTSPDDGDQSGGCGCTVGGERETPIPAAFLLFVASALVLVRRRRR
jgi:MYXO-CTERM domain-containing protein